MAQEVARFAARRHLIASHPQGAPQHEQRMPRQPGDAGRDRTAGAMQTYEHAVGANGTSKQAGAGATAKSANLYVIPVEAPPMWQTRLVGFMTRSSIQRGLSRDINSTSSKYRKKPLSNKSDLAQGGGAQHHARTGHPVGGARLVRPR